eukprot:g23186.t1
MNQLTGTQARLPALLEASEQRAQQELRRESQVAELRKELIHLRQDFVQFTTDGSEAPGSMDEKFHSRLSAMQDTLMTLIEKEAKEKNQAVDALPEVCRALRAEAITMLQEVSRPSLRAVWHNLQRWLLDPIREPKARHILRTPLTRCVRDGLEPLALLAAELGLRPSARLVELNFTISLPGAPAQQPHSDISPMQSLPRIITFWAALQDIDLSMGPTAKLVTFTAV